MSGMSAQVGDSGHQPKCASIGIPRIHAGEDVNYMVSMIPKELIDVCWSDASPLLEKATLRSNGRFDVPSLHAEILRGHQQLWAVFKGDEVVAALTTRIITYPKIKALAIVFCGGRFLVEWGKDMHSLLKRFARDMGCQKMEITGRRGWLKRLEDEGWKPNYALMELDLTEVGHGFR